MTDHAFIGTLFADYFHRRQYTMPRFTGAVTCYAGLVRETDAAGKRKGYELGQHALGNQEHVPHLRNTQMGCWGLPCPSKYLRTCCVHTECPSLSARSSFLWHLRLHDFFQRGDDRHCGAIPRAAASAPKDSHASVPERRAARWLKLHLGQRQPYRQDQSRQDKVLKVPFSRRPMLSAL